MVVFVTAATFVTNGSLYHRTAQRSSRVEGAVEILTQRRHNRYKPQSLTGGA